MPTLTMDDYLLERCGPAEQLKDGQSSRLNAAAKILDFAVELVDEKIWVNRKPARPQHTCAVSAIRDAASQPRASVGDPRDTAKLAYLALQAQANQHQAIGADAISVTSWNDAEGQNKSQVVDAMNNAAHFLRRYAKGNVGAKKAKKRRRR